MSKSLEGRYTDEILAAKGDKDKIKTAIRGIIGDVALHIGSGQREGVRATALAMGYKVADSGSIATMTKDLIEAVRKKERRGDPTEGSCAGGLLNGDY